MATMGLQYGDFAAMFGVSENKASQVCVLLFVRGFAECQLIALGRAHP